MKNLAYCLPSVITDPALRAHPGMKRFTPFFDLYGRWVIPVDRTGTIQTPIRTTSFFPIPKYRVFKKTYAEICDDRARECLRDCEKLSTTMYILYSGGIDSACVIVSLLKNASPEQKKNIVVLLSRESITENPVFYHEHIRGKLRVGSSVTYYEHIGENAYILSAEHNDMVMGSEKIGKLIGFKDFGAINKKYDRETIRDLFALRFNQDNTLADFYVDLLERVRDTAPIPIVSNMDFLWWSNFTLKWQACYFFPLLFTMLRRSEKVTEPYMKQRFISFYNTNDFQLWSMNNLDKRIKDTWESYKYVVKDIIYAYNKDAEYRDHKTKKGSLLPLVGFNPPYRFIDEDMRFRNDLRPEEFLQQENDFV